MEYKQKYENLLTTLKILLESYETFTPWLNIENNIIASGVIQSISKILDEENQNKIY